MSFFLWFNYLHPTFCQPLNFFVAPAQLSKTTLSVRLPTPSPLPHLPPTSQPPPSFLYPHLPLVHQIWDAYIIEVGEDQLETLTVALSRQQNRPKCVPLSIDLSLILQVATWKLSNMINVLSPTELMEKIFVFFFHFPYARPYLLKPHKPYSFHCTCIYLWYFQFFFIALIPYYIRISKFYVFD